MISRRQLISMGLIASIFRSRKSAAQQVLSVGEEGFVDLDFPLSHRASEPSGITRLVARGVRGNKPLGFAVDIPREWKESPLEDGGATFYWGRGALRSIGPPSDNLVTHLAELYQLPVSTSKMLDVIEVDAVGLNSDPRRLETESVHMKLFFHSNTEDRYAEIFLNVDAGRKLIQLHEKDMEYRKNVLRALHEQA